MTANVKWSWERERERETETFNVPHISHPLSSSYVVLSFLYIASYCASSKWQSFVKSVCLSINPSVHLSVFFLVLPSVHPSHYRALKIILLCISVTVCPSVHMLARRIIGKHKNRYSKKYKYGYSGIMLDRKTTSVKVQTHIFRALVTTTKTTMSKLQCPACRHAGAGWD